MPQPDNSRFLGIKTPTSGPIALIEQENGGEKRVVTGFDILSLNKTLTNIRKNAEKAKSETTRTFHEEEERVFSQALESLRNKRTQPLPKH